MPAETSAPVTAVVGILRYPGAQEAAVLGLQDLLETANRLGPDAPAGGRLRLRVRILDPAEGLPAAGAAGLKAVVLPPCLGQGAPPGRWESVTAWLVARHAEGTLLCSVCAGAFLLADTGLLAERPATTHWGLKDAFLARHPDVLLDTDRLIVDDGDIVTAGGLMAWVDLGLRLVHRFLGTSTLLATARHFLVDPGGREQRFYTTFAPTLDHGDADVLRVQHWLQKRAPSKVGLPEMAAKARLGERTFLRRFQRATGLRPTEYLQHLRVGKAREFLELSTLAIEEIAWRVGYEDAGAFRKVFQRVMGLAPGEYRRRFSVRTG